MTSFGQVLSVQLAFELMLPQLLLRCKAPLAQQTCKLRHTTICCYCSAVAAAIRVVPLQFSLQCIFALLLPLLSFTPCSLLCLLLGRLYMFNMDLDETLTGYALSACIRIRSCTCDP